MFRRQSVVWLCVLLLVVITVHAQTEERAMDLATVSLLIEEMPQALQDRIYGYLDTYEVSKIAEVPENAESVEQYLLEVKRVLDAWPSIYGESYTGPLTPSVCTQIQSHVNLALQFGEDIVIEQVTRIVLLEFKRLSDHCKYTVETIQKLIHSWRGLKCPAEWYKPQESDKNWLKRTMHQEDDPEWKERVTALTEKLRFGPPKLGVLIDFVGMGFLPQEVNLATWMTKIQTFSGRIPGNSGDKAAAWNAAENLAGWAQDVLLHNVPLHRAGPLAKAQAVLGEFWNTLLDLYPKLTTEEQIQQLWELLWDVLDGASRLRMKFKKDGMAAKQPEANVL